MDILLGAILKPFLILSAVLFLFYLCYSKLRPIRMTKLEENEKIITEIDIKQSFNYEKINKMKMICKFLKSINEENDEVLNFYEKTFEDVLSIIKKSPYTYNESKSALNFSEIMADFYSYCQKKNIDIDLF